MLFLTVFTSCQDAGESWTDSSSIRGVGTVEEITLPGSDIAFSMVLANTADSITLPTRTDDSVTATLDSHFWIAETELTNETAAAILQWAFNRGKFSTTFSDHNGINTEDLKYGGQVLLRFDTTSTQIAYDGSIDIYCTPGYEQYPLAGIHWYGAILLCNWLTEMRDGNTDNLVYTGIDTDWLHDETIDDPSKTGFRLPYSIEWEYAARYRGSDPTNSVPDFADPYFTRGDSASGAPAAHTTTATLLYAVYCTDGNPYDGEEAKQAGSLGPDSTNALGLFDMSGNVSEWCFNQHATTTSYRVFKSGSWDNDSTHLQVGIGYLARHDSSRISMGLRLCRTDG